MNKEFLEGLGLEEAAVEAILAEHAAQVSGLQLQHQVTMAIGEAGGKNQKAIAALLDLQALAKAEDPQAAIREAVQQLKAENDYLFEAAQPPRYARTTGQADPGASQAPTTLAGALRARMKR